MLAIRPLVPVPPPPQAVVRIPPLSAGSVRRGPAPAATGGGSPGGPFSTTISPRPARDPPTPPLTRARLGMLPAGGRGGAWRPCSSAGPAGNDEVLEGFLPLEGGGRPLGGTVCERRGAAQPGRERPAASAQGRTGGGCGPEGLGLFGRGVPELAGGVGRAGGGGTEDAGVGQVQAEVVHIGAALEVAGGGGGGGGAVLIGGRLPAPAPPLLLSSPSSPSPGGGAGVGVAVATAATAPSPCAFTARMRKLYSVPLVSPVTMWLGGWRCCRGCPSRCQGRVRSTACLRPQ